MLTSLLSIYSTESDNYYGLVGKDPRWEKFQAFHDYLFSAFPLLYAFFLKTIQELEI